MIGRFLDWLRDRSRRRRWNPRIALGRRGEDLAHRFLREKGYVIVARNYRLGSGDAEADLIAWDQDALVFVEVKTRSSEDFGPPERAVGEEKRKHMRRAALDYTRRRGLALDRVRYDLVTVVIGRKTEIQLYQGFR